MRVHERGAGITEACGTGAAARRGRRPAGASSTPAPTELVVHMDGGSARVALDRPEPGRVTLTGPATFVATIEVPATVSNPYPEALGATLIERSVRERIVLVGVTFPGSDDETTEASLDELAALIDTAGADEVGRMVQRRDHPDHTWFIGKGKAEELHELCLAVDADTVVFDNELSPAQQYNLEKLLGRTAIDRTAVILDIFAQNAHTLEGKAQVELALLRYRLPRLRRGATAKLSQQRGGVGTRFGGGETKLEVDRRRIMRRISKLEGELEELGRTRQLQRQQRDRSGLAAVTIVGYTNAGKSTLLNTLTDAGVLTEDRLFATLDPTTRRLSLPGGEPVLLTDTVGFVRRLPHGLVESFKSTLEVASRADYLVHVVDASAADPEGQIDAVREVLAEIDADARARAARVQQGRPGAAGGQAARRRPPRLGRRQRRRPARASTTSCACSRDRLRSITHGRRAGRAVRPRRRAGRDPPRGRGRLVDRRARARCACGPGCPTRRPAGWPSSSSPRAGRDGAERAADRLRPAAVPVRPARPAAAGRRRARRRRRRPVDRHADGPAAAGRRRRVLDVGRRARLPAEHRHGRPPRAPSPRGSTAASTSTSRSAAIGACIGTKEFVGTLPQWLRLRTPGPRHGPVPGDVLPDLRDGGDPRRLPAGRRCRCGRPAASTSTPIDAADADRALALWVNSPGNPTGAVDDLGAVAAWGRAHGVPVFSDECYVEFTWDGPGPHHPRARPRRRRRRALAVEALEPGRRAGRLLRRRPRPRPLPPGGPQARRDDGARARPRRPASSPSTTTSTSRCSASATAAGCERMAEILGAWSGRTIALPAGGFYLWFPVGDGWAFAERLAAEGGAVVSPGEFYGAGAADHVRVAVVQPDERIELVAERLGV